VHRKLRSWVAGIGVAVMWVGGVAGQPSSEIVVIGCLQRGAQNAFSLKDYRSGVTYRIEADAESIGWHVGHELELRGPIERGADGLRLKPSQVIFISTKCSS
jgi:hypothetical protein